MNLVDAAVVERGGRPHALLSDGLALPLPGAVAARWDLGREVVIGFRAEALAPRGHGLPGSGDTVEIDRRVSLAEPLGTETLLFTDLGGREVQGRMLSPRAVEAGERMPFVLDLSRLHVFAKTDGRSLRA